MTSKRKMVLSCKSQFGSYSCVFEVTATVSSCGSRAIGLLPPRSLVRKARYVASGAVRQFERTGGKEPLVAARTYSKVPGRAWIAHTPKATGSVCPATGSASPSPTGPKERPCRASSPAGCSCRPAGCSCRPPGTSGSSRSAKAGRSGPTPRRRPHAGRAGRGGQADRLDRGGGGDAGQRQPQ